MSINRAPFNALVDDDGTGTTGTVWNTTQIKNVLLDPIDAALLTPIQYPTVTGVQHDFVLANPGMNCRLVWGNSGVLTLDGITGGITGQTVTIIAGGGQIDLVHQGSGSASTNRFQNVVTSGPTSIAGYGKAVYAYESQFGFWRLIDHEQGAWIQPPFAATDYTGNGSMTWTVDPGDVFCPLMYRLDGKTLALTFDLVNTTVGGSVNFALQIRIPGGFTSAPNQRVGGGLIVTETGVSVPGSYISIGGGITALQLIKSGAANWTASTNATRVQGLATFEVQ
jgi:hypothetical protein